MLQLLRQLVAALVRAEFDVFGDIDGFRAPPHGRVYVLHA